MDSINKLREQIKTLFNDATDKAQIESAASLNGILDEVEKEETELLHKHSELLKDYKEAVLHSSFSKPGQGDPAGEHPEPKALSFEDALDSVIKARKK